MGTAVCRLGDSASGNCSLHSGLTAWVGTTSVASGGFTVDGIQVCTVGDTGPTSCGHHFRIINGSTVTTGANGEFVAKVGSNVDIVEGGTGTGTIVSGSNTCTTD